MIVSIMQPYFFPYIGYFQLMAACDLFIVFDDAQYIDRGWVNRNRILLEGRPQWITMPVSHADHTLPINRRDYLLDDRLSLRIRRRIASSYRNAPLFRETMPLVEEILDFPESNVARFNTHLLQRIAEHLRIDTRVRAASEVNPHRMLAGQEAVIDLCLRSGAKRYINPIGGLQLYSTTAFRDNGIELRFLRSKASAYPQGLDVHAPALSIIDVLMFNDVSAVRRMLDEHELLSRT